MDVGLGYPTVRRVPSYPLGVGFDGRVFGVGADPKFLGDKLWPGQSLHVNEALKSRNGRVKVILQSDGNCVLYGDGKPLWWTGVRPGVNVATMQSDGNFVLTKPGEGKVWASDTEGHPGGYLFLQDDANFVLYWRVGGSALWSSQTNGFRYYGGPGKPITVDDVLEVAGDVIAVAQVVVSFVPGVGAGINAAIAAGEALAKGENITDAVASAAKNALPGGPLAAAAFDVAVAAGKSIARGDSIDDVALAATRAALPSDEAKKAFDVGLAVIHGQNVQQAVVGAVALAAHALPPALTNIAKSLPPEVTRVATAIYNRPELQSMAVAEVAKLLKTDAATATKAVATVKSVPPPPPMSPQAAATKLFAALLIWGSKPNDVGAQQQLVGTSWQWGAAMKGAMTPDDTALANAIAAWSKKSGDGALQKTLTNVSQRWAAAKGVIPKKPLKQVHETAPAAKPPAAPPATPKAAPMATPKPAAPPAKPALVATAAKAGMYGPYPKGTVAGLQAPPHVPHGGPHGHGGGGGRPLIRTPMRGGPGWWWDVPWQPQTVTRTETCQTWGSPIELPPQMLTAAKVALNVSQNRPTTVRGPDNVLYLFQMENGAITARPCAGSALS